MDKKKSDFVDSGFVKTCDELVIDFGYGRFWRGSRSTGKILYDSSSWTFRSWLYSFAHHLHSNMPKITLQVSPFNLSSYLHNLLVNIYFLRNKLYGS